MALAVSCDWVQRGWRVGTRYLCPSLAPPMRPPRCLDCGPSCLLLRRVPALSTHALLPQTMLEQWEAGSEEPPHAHPGDDLTVVVEGEMAVQFFTRGPGGALVKDGAPLVLKKGDAGHIAAGRIHDAKYVKHCKLVYVHSGAFGFDAAK